MTKRFEALSIDGEAPADRDNEQDVIGMQVIAECVNGNCPKVIDPEDNSGDALVQGYATDVSAPKGERVVRLPASVLAKASAGLQRRQSAAGLEGFTPESFRPEHFGQLFQRFTATAFRLETLQRYTVDEELQAIESWRAGRARPEFSVRTSPWAAQLATSTIAGKRWRRVRVVDLPLSEYVRWEMAAYVESAVLGEEIRVLVRTDAFAGLTEDFWLFDAAEATPLAVAQRYDSVGRPGNHQLVTDPEVITSTYAATALRAWNAATPFNEWLTKPGYDLCRPA